MKLFKNKEGKGCRGIAMTEYLIILAIVAIAAIAVVGIFGKQIKSAFTSSTGAMAGTSMKNSNMAKSSAVKTDTMGTFTSKANQGGK
jgi:pilus assembly protein Flp/PilA